jgi:hypothetical protein
MLKLTRGWFFYRVPEHFGFSAQEACLPRDILWHLPFSRWRDVQIELSTVSDIVVCIWRLWTGREHNVWYCCMHLTVMNRERVQCLILLYAFDIMLIKQIPLSKWEQCNFPVISHQTYCNSCTVTVYNLIYTNMWLSYYMFRTLSAILRYSAKKNTRIATYEIDVQR